MLRTLTLIVTLSVLVCCSASSVRPRPIPTFDTIVDVTVFRGVKAIVVTHSDHELVSFDQIFRFDEPKIVVSGTCESPQGPMRCLWWELRGRECWIMPNREAPEECKTYERSGVARQGFGFPSTSITFDRLDRADTTYAEVLTHQQVRVMISQTTQPR